MITVKVSVGEAIDKLTILDIKRKNLRNESLEECEREYSNLSESISSSTIDKLLFEYRILRNINQDIFNALNVIRNDGIANEKICTHMLNLNDMRFRIKDIINRKVASAFREQKTYNKKTALFVGHCGLGDIINMVGAIRYIALQFDKTYIAIDNGPKNEKNIKAFFAEDPSIEIVYIDSPGYSLDNYDMVFKCGYYKTDYIDLTKLADSFYDHLGFDRNIRFSYFNLPQTIGSVNMYEKLKGHKYVFVQQKSSNRFTSLIKWDINEILTIDPNINMYPETHEWHALAEACINNPFLDYIDTIKHASQVHVVDSAFYCLSSQLILDADIKVCYDRMTGNVFAHNGFMESR